MSAGALKSKPTPPPGKGRRRALVWGVVALIVVAGALAGLNYYPAWRQERMLQQARAAMAASEWRLAFLAANQVVRSNPDSVEGCQVMAQLMERLRIPQSMYWRRRLAELQPEVGAHYVKWAQAAIQHGEFAIAEQALTALRDKSGSSALYHHLMASVHLATKQTAKAEASSLEAARLAPTNSFYQLNVAVIQVGSTNETKRGAARKQLETIAAGEIHTKEALRALVADALERKDQVVAMKHAGRLAGDSKALIGDRIQFLHLLAKSGQADELAASLTTLQQEVRNKPPEILELVNWMIEARPVDEALRWLNTLAQDVRYETPTQMALVNAMTRAKDWAGMESVLRRSSWDELDFLRLASLARSFKERGSDQKAELQWNAALTAAGGRPESLLILVRTVSAWKWTKETHDLLWVIARGRSNPKQALQALYRYYQAASDTQGLYRVLTRMIEVDRADEIALNNYAAIALLLNVNTARAHQIAADLHAKDDTNPIFVATLAYSLHLQGKTREGRALMEGLAPAILEKPAVAAYYGILLAKDGARDRAEKYFLAAETAELLPQERDLVAQARNGK